ncbi:MAG TPA: hypothetical protein PKX38_08645 [Alphaproteobacteria bacterium]|jgi:hypothetical protein|nr:hypothetical protein [Micavibrio sp.]MBK9561820.1 hypothetical protein [Micavibrio sp.]HQX27985.1 hypothetical protein [Alphaproteobacteria bacterium]
MNTQKSQVWDLIVLQAESTGGDVFAAQAMRDEDTRQERVSEVQYKPEPSNS